MNIRLSTTRAAFAVAALLAATCTATPHPAIADGKAFEAMQILTEGDRLIGSGRLGPGYSVYLGLLKQFPTWWLPTVKAASAAKALGLPLETVRAYLDRAVRMSPSGPYLPLVRFLVDAQDPEATPRPLVFGFGKALWVDRANRLSLARAMECERQKKIKCAEKEYREILERSPLCTTARFRLSRVLSLDGRAGEASRVLEDGAGHSLFPPRWKAVAGQGRRAMSQEIQISY